MAVKKKISPDMDKFIDKGAGVKPSKECIFKNILVRMPNTILNQIDELVAYKPWVNRTQWIVEAVHEKLTKEGV